MRRARYALQSIDNHGCWISAYISVANDSLARFSTPSGAAIWHSDSGRPSTTTYAWRHRQTSFLVHWFLAPVRVFQFGGALTSSRRRQTSFLALWLLAPARGFQFGGTLTSSLSQFGGALTEPAIREDSGSLAALTGDRFWKFRWWSSSSCWRVHYSRTQW